MSENGIEVWTIGRQRIDIVRFSRYPRLHPVIILVVALLAIVVGLVVALVVIQQTQQFRIDDLNATTSRTAGFTSYNGTSAVSDTVQIEPSATNLASAVRNNVDFTAIAYHLTTAVISFTLPYQEGISWSSTRWISTNVLSASSRIPVTVHSSPTPQLNQAAVSSTTWFTTLYVETTFRDTAPLTPSA